MSGIGNIVVDNIGLSNYTTIFFPSTIAGVTNFTEAGTRAASTFKLNDGILTATGLNTQFGLYFNFTAAGTQTNSDALNAAGSFSSLHFDLYGYKVTGEVTYDASNTTPMGVTNPLLLASGDLVSGGTAVVNGGPAAFQGYRI